MTSFDIIGTGTMGKAIGSLLAEGGSTVSYITHDQVGTVTLTGDIVILAVPHPAVASVVDAYRDALAGKVVVDITNPVNFETFDSLVVPAGTSFSAQLQTELPESTVLKAFNTNFAATLISKTVGGQRTTVLIAGDDTAAKAALARAIEAGGIAAVDAGSLARAIELEAMGFLQITLAAGEKIGWTGGFAVVA
ncbi:MAG TPA: NADPH-dependent F420 reductase [Propionicimonas sp.]|nr:NADPH-dependent F420 reductase [Propionicimonas sp.]